MKHLPPDAVAYRRTREFSEATIPAALRHRHATKSGVWGRIAVLEGSLRYRILEPVLEEQLLSPEHPGVVEPEVAHEVEPVGKVRFFVEFLRREEASAGAREVPSQFYRGLVADLYEPLVSEHARAETYVPFLERSGTPALELACGSGLPLLELVERGFDVAGLDASQDMLDRCRARAAERSLRVELHHGEMQSFSLARRYRSIFLAGASFTLLTSDEDAASALGRIHAHLEAGGSALIPLEIPDTESLSKQVGRFREVTTDAGDCLRVGLVAFDVDPDGRGLCRRLRYERIPPEGEPEVVERDWKTRWWSQDQIREMLLTAGFEKVTLMAPTGGRADPGDATFVALARTQERAAR